MAEPIWRSLPVVVVDSIPMDVHLNSEGRHPYHLPAPREWVFLFGAPKRFTPNRLDPCVDLRPGTLVWIGGFEPSPLGPESSAFWKEPASIVKALVESLDDPKGELVELLVPPGDYAGFLGGPAAIATPNEAFAVWGIVVSISAEGDRLTAKRLFLPRP